MAPLKLKGSPWRGLTGTTLGFFFGFSAVALYGPTAAKFREAMDLTPSMVGLLVAIPALTGSLLRIPFGAWVDITGGRKPFLMLLLLSFTGMLGITLLLKFTYPSGMHGMYGLILFFGMLSGCGIATFSVGIGQTSYWFPASRQGMALGIYGGLGNLAPGLFSLILPVFLLHFGFISAYFAWTMFLLCGIVIYWFAGVNSYYFQYKKYGLSENDSRNEAGKMGQQLFPSGNVKSSLLNSAGSINTWKLVLLYFTTFGGFIALTAWFPVYWGDFHGYAPVKAGFYTAIFSLFASAIRVAGGSVADRIGGERASIISLSLVLAGSLLLVLTHTAILEIVSIVILATGMGINNAAVFKLAPRYVPRAIGGAAGWIGGVGAFGGFVIPPILGDIVDAHGKKGYSEGFIIFTILSVISLVVVSRLIRRSPSN